MIWYDQCHQLYNMYGSISLKYIIHAYWDSNKTYIYIMQQLGNIYMENAINWFLINSCMSNNKTYGIKYAT